MGNLGVIWAVRRGLLRFAVCFGQRARLHDGSGTGRIKALAGVEFRGLLPVRRDCSGVCCDCVEAVGARFS
jgi:hypothetical protein